jgi:hypothetical protein
MRFEELQTTTFSRLQSHKGPNAAETMNGALQVAPLASRGYALHPRLLLPSLPLVHPPELLGLLCGELTPREPPLHQGDRLHSKTYVCINSTDMLRGGAIIKFNR